MLFRSVLVKKVFNSGHDCVDAKTNAANNLGFALGYKGVSSVIVGTINSAHLESNAAAVEKL